MMQELTMKNEGKRKKMGLRMKPQDTAKLLNTVDKYRPEMEHHANGGIVQSRATNYIDTWDDTFNPDWIANNMEWRIYPQKPAVGVLLNKGSMAIELTPEVKAALNDAGIDYKRN